MVMMMKLLSKSGIFCLKCEVGHNNETKEMDCHGSWDQMQMTMKEKLGDTWDDIKQNMIDLEILVSSGEISPSYKAPMLNVKTENLQPRH